MSILNVVVAPNASWFDVHNAASLYGTPCAFFKPRGESISFDFAGWHRTYFGPLRIVYTEHVDVFRRSGALQKLESSRSLEYLVILGCSNYQFKSLPTYEGTIHSLVSAHLEFAKESSSTEISFEEVPHHAEALKRYQRDSVLNKVSQMLYRIRDKEDRATVGLEVYRYLSGARKKVPSTPVSTLEGVLRSEVALRYNAAGKAIREGADIDRVCTAFKVDRFEVGYCLRKSKVSDELLDRIAFKD
jgi:hypothetical protein